MLPWPNRLRDRIVDREVMKLQLREAKRKAAEQPAGHDAHSRRPEKGTSGRPA
jgi:hypothetical protein